MSPEGLLHERTRDGAFQDHALDRQVAHEVAHHLYPGDELEDAMDRTEVTAAGIETLARLRQIIGVAAATIECSKNGEQ